jgi:hypothetical protein
MPVRYFRGSIKLSLGRDHALLRQVLYSGFVSQEQLWEFMVEAGCEQSRHALNWRIKRLVDHGFLERHVLANIRRSFVYSLTSEGVHELVNLDQCHAGASGFYKRKSEGDSVVHALDLNDIHLSLIRSGLLRQWKSSLEVRSQNEFTDYGYAKDYDAVMTLELDGALMEIALEYEREVKSEVRYQKIVAAIQGERAVDRFLYLVPDYHILSFVRYFFRHSRRAIYFGLARDFRQELLLTRVEGPQVAYASLKQALGVRQEAR